MQYKFSYILVSMLLLLTTTAIANKDKYQETIEVFRNAVESKQFFSNSYGYAVFPTIGKAGFGVGGAYGRGQVYVNDTHVGNSEMGQLTVGFQLGGQAYSQIVFFEHKAAFEDFTNGSFEFGAEASAVAITAGASAAASTAGSSAGASGDKTTATNYGTYYKGMAVFTVAKGGLMYEISIGGQKFGYRPVG